MPRVTQCSVRSPEGRPAPLALAFAFLQPSKGEIWDPERRGCGEGVQRVGAVPQGKANLLSLSEGAVPCVKASEPEGGRAFIAYQSRPPATLSAPGTGYQSARPFSFPWPVRVVPTVPLPPLSGSFTAFSTLLSLERREGPSVWVQECGYSFESGGGGGTLNPRRESPPTAPPNPPSAGARPTSGFLLRPPPPPESPSRSILVIDPAEEREL